MTRLSEAYSKGIFPWSSHPVTWWSPDPRAVLEFQKLRVSRRLRQKIRQQRYEIRTNTAFRRVVKACAAPRFDGDGSWIDAKIVGAYERLHEAGLAHSLEVWRKGSLIGGIYGVATGGAFAGESMFHRETDASKIALFHLVERLEASGFELFDAQVLNPFTASMGAEEVPRADFLRRLKSVEEKPCIF